MKRYLLIGASALFLLTVILACSPRPAPTPVSTPQPTPSATTAPTSNLSPVRQTQGELPTSQDTAWSQVEEAAKKEGRLVIYGGSTLAQSGKEVQNVFTARYGIPMDILILGGSQQVEKLKVERGIGKSVADVSQGGVSSLTDIVLSGTAESVAEALPVLRDRSVFYIDPVYGPQKQIIGFLPTILGPLINTNLVKPDEIKSWYDILNPRWKGRIIMDDPRTTGAGINAFSTLTYHKVLDHEYFRRLARQEPMLWGAGTRESLLQVGRGEQLINFAASNNNVAPFIAEGAPIKIIAVEEGNISQLLAALVVKGAPHPNAAKLFINWLLTPEGQRTVAKSSSTLSLRKDVPDFTPEKARFTPKKIWDRTWDVAEQSNEDLKSKITEQIFGRK